MRTRAGFLREKEKTHRTAYCFRREGTLHFLCDRVTRHQYRGPDITEGASLSRALSCLACSTRLLRIRTVASLASATVRLIKGAHLPRLSKSAFETQGCTNILHSNTRRKKSQHLITHIALKVASNMIQYSACLRTPSELQSDGSPVLITGHPLFDVKSTLLCHIIGKAIEPLIWCSTCQALKY